MLTEILGTLELNILWSESSYMEVLSTSFHITGRALGRFCCSVFALEQPDLVEGVPARCRSGWNEIS